MKKKLSLILINILIASGLTSCQNESRDHILYHNGDILTMSGDTPEYVESIVTKGEKIIFTGTLKKAKEKYEKVSKSIDLKKRTMLPGFIDGHGHVYGVGLQASVANLLPSPDGVVNTVEELIKELKESRNDLRYKKFFEDTGWILGFGYDDSQMDRYPEAKDLDKVSTEYPVYIVHTSGHVAVANTKALELSQINETTKDPQGGHIKRIPGTMKPNGILEENAHFKILFSLFGKVSDELNEYMFLEGQKLYASYGHTTAEEGRAKGEALSIMIKATEKKKNIIDVVVYPDIEVSRDSMKSSYVSKLYKNQLRIGGVKLSLDGSPQGKTAWLSEAYHIAPHGHSKGYKGSALMNDEKAKSHILDAYKNNWQILVHTNGDAAIDQFIRAIEAANKKYGNNDRRPVMIHGQTLRQDQIPKLKSNGIFPALFPMHTFYWGDWHRESVLGPKRAEKISPTMSIVKAGMKFSTHHDAPVVIPNAMRVLDATVNRTTRSNYILGPDQRVGPYIALKAMTDWAAYAHHEEKIKGTLEIGKQADFVILDKNPLKVEKNDIDQIKILNTISRGKTIYSSIKNK
jgi:predicted amidohydrolase YtcJ